MGTFERYAYCRVGYRRRRAGQNRLTDLWTGPAPVDLSFKRAGASYPQVRAERWNECPSTFATSRGMEGERRFRGRGCRLREGLDVHRQERSPREIIQSDVRLEGPHGSGGAVNGFYGDRRSGSD